MNQNSKKLYKTKDGATLGGVCKGISEVYNLDVTVVRILFFIITVVGGGLPIIPYFILYVIIPDKTEVIRGNKRTFSDDYTINEDEYRL